MPMVATARQTIALTVSTGSNLTKKCSNKVLRYKKHESGRSFHINPSTVVVVVVVVVILESPLSIQGRAVLALLTPMPGETWTTLGALRKLFPLYNLMVLPWFMSLLVIILNSRLLAQPVFVSSYPLSSLIRYLLLTLHHRLLFPLDFSLYIHVFLLLISLF